MTLNEYREKGKEEFEAKRKKDGDIVITYLDVPLEVAFTRKNIYCDACDGFGYVKAFYEFDEFNPDGFLEADHCERCGASGIDPDVIGVDQYEKMEELHFNMHQLWERYSQLVGEVHKLADYLQIEEVAQEDAIEMIIELSNAYEDD